jgi:hypothetical protein
LACYIFAELDSYNLIRTWTFLALAFFIFNGLTIIQRCKTTTALNFRMMNKKVFPAIFWRNKTETFVCVEPLNGTFTHNIFSVFIGEK